MRGPDHGFLFQPSDLQRFRSSQVVVSPLDDDDPELGEADRGFARPLRTILPRLELLAKEGRSGFSSGLSTFRYRTCNPKQRIV